MLGPTVERMDGNEQEQRTRPKRRKVALASQIEEPAAHYRRDDQQQADNADSVEPDGWPIIFVHPVTCRPSSAEH